ncbi:MAG: hydroxylamine reductase, partial [Thermococci archaeon]|nr:hydroxylamine reductase [Thermococci archaeon]
VLSWMEQKAIGILYSLLYLGIKGIYIGPKAPEFFTPNVFETLRKKFDLRLISEPEEDLKRMLNSTTAVSEDSPLLD